MATILNTTIQLKRGNADKWRELNPILDRGEPGYEIDTNRLKIGDGTTSWNNLKYLGEKETENILEGIKIGGNALEIAEDKTVDIPIAGENLGVVKTSTAENGVSIDENGSMSVNSLNTNKLVQNGGEYIILYGGSASDNII